MEFFSEESKKLTQNPAPLAGSCASCFLGTVFLEYVSVLSTHAHSITTKNKSSLVNQLLFVAWSRMHTHMHISRYFFSPFHSLMLLESRGVGRRLERLWSVQQQGPRHGETVDAYLFYWAAVRRSESTLESRRAKSRPLFLGLGCICCGFVHRRDQPYVIYVSSMHVEFVFLFV